ncbi:MAG: universal stress protein, partial [Actinomycetota bacterium]|nr:universal stress protein [Actinomycetota bacterium]
MYAVLAADGSPGGKTAVRLVRNLDWPEGSTIRVVHAIPAAVAGLPRGSGGRDDGRLAHPLLNAVSGTHELLETTVATLRGPSRRVEHSVLHGDVASAIARDARRVGADLVVAGHPRAGRVGSAIFGSVAPLLVDQSPCPVLIARRAKLGSVLFADDGSKGAERAAAAVIELAIVRGAPVSVLSVAPHSDSRVLSTWPAMRAHAHRAYSEVRAAAFSEAQAIATARADFFEAAGTRTDVHVVEGDPADTIVSLARRLD